MRTFLALTQKSIRRQLTYRAAIIAGFVTNLFFGIIKAAILIALYGPQTEVAGLTVIDAVTYAGLSQAVIGYLSIFRWYDVMQSIQSGQIASELIRPIGYFTFWMTQDLGRALVQLALRGVLFMIAFRLFYPISWPAGGWQWLSIGAAVCLSWLVSFAWRFMINLPAFWTPNALGFSSFLLVLSWFFSGMLMPLRYFPGWVITIAQLTPFPAMINTVVEIYLGVLSGPELAAAVLNQALWAVILILGSQLILRAGVRRLVIQGG